MALAGCHEPVWPEPAGLMASGEFSLYAGAMGTLGLTYFGPTMQPVRSSRTRLLQPARRAVIPHLPGLGRRLRRREPPGRWRGSRMGRR